MVAATKVDGRPVPQAHPAQPARDRRRHRRRRSTRVARRAPQLAEPVEASPDEDPRLRRRRPRPVQPRPGLPDRSARATSTASTGSSSRPATGFDWHPGMLLDDATLQVPFLADLVTMADPTSRWSFLNYLKRSGNLYPFYIRESFYPLRREYDDYCRWAAERLDSVRFGQRVDGGRARRADVPNHHGDGGDLAQQAAGARDWYVAAHPGRALPGPAASGARRGHPLVRLPRPQGGPPAAADDHHRRQRPERGGDLLRPAGRRARTHGYELVWLTRSPRFFPMEYTKLTLEMTSPEYGAYHRALPVETRDRLAPRAAAPVQGHQRRPGRRDLRPALPAARAGRRSARRRCSPTPRSAARGATGDRVTSSTCSTSRRARSSG